MINDIIIKGIDYSDYPDFSDAYIYSATKNGIELSESELEELNEDKELVYELIIKNVF